MSYYVGTVDGSTPDVSGLLGSGWQELGGRADAAFQAAMGLAGAGLNFGAVTVAKTTPPTVAPITMSVPGAPATPVFGNAPSAAFVAPSFGVPSYFAGNAPSFSSVVPALSFLSKPIVTQPVDPGASPTLSSVVLPSAPTVALPSVPTLRDLDLPDAPVIYVAPFTGVSPSGDVPDFEAPSFSWSEAPYTPRLTALATKIAEYLAFDYDAAETAIWERGQERVLRTTNEAVLDLANDFASRGFALPTGAMVSAVREARMKGAEARYDNAREAMIKAAELNTAKLTLAIQSGIQYEGQWMTYQTQVVERALKAALFTVDIIFKTFEAQTALFNARLLAYQTEAQVHRDLIQAELLKLEGYKAQLEGQRLIGQINLQDVELYKASLQGVLAVIEVYKSELQASNTIVEIDRNRISAFLGQIDAYKSKIQANATEYSAWGETIKAEATKAQVYETEVRAFGAQVDAYRAQETTKMDGARLQLDSNRLSLEGFAATIQAFDAQLRSFSAQTEAQSRLYAGQAQVFAAQTGANEAQARVSIASAGNQIELYKTQASTNIEEARVQVALLDADLRALVGRLDSAGRVLAQLAGSAMAAFNLSASASANFGLGISNSLNESHNFSG